MKTDKKQSTRIQNAQSQLLNYKIQQLNMMSYLSGDTKNDNHHVAVKDISLPETGENVSVSIFFGRENQTGSSTLKILRTNQDARFINQSTSDMFIGKSSELIGQVLDIESNITDTNRDELNNDTVLIVEIKLGNKSIYHDQYTIKVKEEGGTASFTHYITFY